MNFVLSHNDLDGYGCILTAIKMGKPLNYINTGYDNITLNLNKILSESIQTGKIQTLYITDLNFSEPDTILLYSIVKHNPNIDIIYIDHHHYESEKQNKIFEKMKEFPNFKFIHTQKYSATYIFYQYCLKKGLIEYDADYDKVMYLIDVFDNWRDTDPLFKSALYFNDVFIDTINGDFLTYFINQYKITDELKTKMKDIAIAKQEYYKVLEQNNAIIRFDNILLLMADKFISHMTIDFPNFKYYINGRSRGAISIRFGKSVENPIEVKNSILKLVESSPFVLSAGGHPSAMGITLHHEHKDKMIHIIEIVAKHLDSLK